MNLPIFFFVAITGLLVSYYISEYTHITHTPRVLARKFSTKKKEFNSIETRKILGTEEMQALDPFLQFFHMYMKKGEGLKDHPHRGYDTITYVLSGELAYEDFRNNSGVLSKGDTQWLFTGKGIIHSEFAVTDCEIIQFWVNLKPEYRLSPFSFQVIQNEDALTVSQEGVTVKIIAGESLGRVMYTITRNPTYVLDALIEPQKVWLTDIPAGWNCLVYVLNGKIKIDEDSLIHFEVGLLSQWDTDLEIKCVSKNKCRVFLIAADTVGGLLVNFGQFYMPNYPLADQANRDWKNGVNGFEGANDWKSSFNK